MNEAVVRAVNRAQIDLGQALRYHLDGDRKGYADNIKAVIGSLQRSVVEAYGS